MRWLQCSILVLFLKYIRRSLCLCLEWFAQSFKEVSRTYLRVSVSSPKKIEQIIILLFPIFCWKQPRWFLSYYRYLAISLPKFWLKKTIFISSRVVAAVCSEFHRWDTSGSAVLASSRLSVLWHFHLVAQIVAFLLLAKFVFSATFLLCYVSKLVAFSRSI